MLSQAIVVKTRKAIESLYDGRCTISEYRKSKRENGSTGFSETIVHEGISCRLSFKTLNSANPGASATAVTQTVKVFLAPEINVKPGSKLTITQNGVATAYKASGEPAIYSTHQEIILDLFEGWA